MNTDLRNALIRSFCVHLCPIFGVLICAICEICVLFFTPIQAAFAFVVVNLSLYLGFGAEVEEQADFIGGGFEVVEELGFVFGGDGAGGFEFDDDGFVDE